MESNWDIGGLFGIVGVRLTNTPPPVAAELLHEVHLDRIVAQRRTV
jgi:hypothetical protein